MRKSIQVGDGLAEFFGTHDGNVKYLESILNVQIQLHDDTLTIDGPDQKVALVDRLISDYLQLRSEGVRFSNGDLKSIIRIISEDESQSLRGVMARSAPLIVGKRTLTPKHSTKSCTSTPSRKTTSCSGSVRPVRERPTWLSVWPSGR